MSLIRNVYIHDGSGNPIGSIEQPDGSGNFALNIHNSHVHIEPILERFHYHPGTEEQLTISASAGSTSITVVNGASFSIGQRIQLYEGTVEESDLITITNIVGNVLTLDRPIDMDFTTSAYAKLSVSNMAVSATLGSPMLFYVEPPAGVVWHIDRLTGLIYDNAVMDDSKLGGIAAVTNGLLLRVAYGNGTYENIGCIKNNQEIYMICGPGRCQYADKAPAGYYGFRWEMNFGDGDYIIRLDGDAGDALQILVQDDLSGLVSFYAIAQGHREGGYVSGS